MTHHSKQESDPPFKVNKGTKFTTNLALAGSALVLAAAVGAGYISLTRDVQGAIETNNLLELKVSRQQDQIAKMAEDVTVTRTKVDLILQHIERRDVK